MKFLPSRGTFPQLKDFDMHHVIKAMVPGTSDTWKAVNIFHFPSSIFTSVPVKGKPGSYKVDINTLQPIIELSRFYSRAFGKNTPVKIARRMMEKLLKKGFIEVSERQISIGLSSLRRSKRWKLRYYQITYKGFVYLQTPPKTRFDLFNPKSAKSFQAYLRKCKEEDDSRAVAVSKETAKTAEETGSPINTAALEKLKAMKAGREDLLEAMIRADAAKRPKVELLTPRPLAQIILSRLATGTGLIGLIQIINEKELQEVLAKNSRLPAVEPYIATQQINPFIVKDETGTHRYVAVMGDKAFVIADYDKIKPKEDSPEEVTHVGNFAWVMNPEKAAGATKITEVRYFYLARCPMLQILSGDLCSTVPANSKILKAVAKLLSVVRKEYPLPSPAKA